MTSPLVVKDFCTAEDVARDKPWVLANDTGLPVEQLFNIVYGVLVYLFFCSIVHILFLNYKIHGPTVEEKWYYRVARSKHFWYRVIFFVLAVIWGVFNLERSCRSCYENVEDQCGNWRLLFWYGLALIISSNVSLRPIEFYLGEGTSFVQNFQFYFLGKRLPTEEEADRVAIHQEDRGEGNVRFSTLMPSVFITWIFAKSIYNSAILGGMYGMLGGLGYASWYISFLTAGVVCYLLRTRYGFKSMAQAIYTNYGVVGIFCYMFAICFRLFNEVWSNATVIGTFYGSLGSSGYWGACWLSTLIPAIYVTMGGMRASLFSDVVQAFFAVLFLVVVLSAIGGDSTFSDATDAFSYKPKKGWTDDGWWALFLGGLIQGTLSYPFFDPVLTDRGFLGTPKTMLLSFTVGGVIAALFIFFYAVIGIYGTFYHEYFQTACGCTSGLPVNPTADCPKSFNPCSRISSANGDSAFASWVLGHQVAGVLEIFVNFVMITASMSTLDSTFTSWGKLVSLDFGGWLRLPGDRRGFLGPLRPIDLDSISGSHLALARGSIMVIFLLGVAFLGSEKDAMAATSAAGTMVMGIGFPIWTMTFWRTKTDAHKGWVQAPLAFAAPVIVGFIFGYLYYNDGKGKTGVTYDEFTVGSKDDKPFVYSRFLGVNLIGHAICFGVFLIFFAFHQLLPKAWLWELKEVSANEEEIKVHLDVPVKDETSPAKKEVDI